MNLDVASPSEVSAALRKVVQFYFESAQELRSAWQDRNAGKDWDAIALILMDAVDDKIGVSK